MRLLAARRGAEMSWDAITRTVLDGPGDDSGFWSEYLRVLHRFYDGMMSRQDWDRWYGARLPAVLRHVKNRSPFYRTHLAGVDPERVTPETLRALPFTTKDDLRRAGYDILSGSPAEASVCYETTGTTGTSTPCPRGVKDI